jgi:hypothetical protein
MNTHKDMDEKIFILKSKLQSYLKHAKIFGDIGNYDNLLFFNYKKFIKMTRTHFALFCVYYVFPIIMQHELILIQIKN